MGLIGEIGHEVRHELVAESRALPWRAAYRNSSCTKSQARSRLLAGRGDRVDHAGDDRVRQFVGQGQRQRRARQRSIAGAGRREIIAQALVGRRALARQRQQLVIAVAIGRDADDMGDGIAQRGRQRFRIFRNAAKRRFASATIVASPSSPSVQIRLARSSVVSSSPEPPPSQPIRSNTGRSLARA